VTPAITPRHWPNARHWPDWDGYAARRAQSEAEGRLRSRSITYYVDNTGVFNERMELRFDPSGE
jgi:carbon-monoxide dehydrogenase large subunit